MMTLSTTAGYAIQALTCLAAPKCAKAMIQEIAVEAGLPAPYLAKIMKRLNQAGIVASKRGIKGGIWLARPAAEITLLDIMNATDGPDYLKGCLLGGEFCTDDRNCPTHSFWKKTREQIRRALAAHTLADVVAFTQRRQRPGARARRAARLAGLVSGS